ncbi:MAG: hypothetical protein AMXMBFR58_30380 [Phycisphaerae bacterium]
MADQNSNLPQKPGTAGQPGAGQPGGYEYEGPRKQRTDSRQAEAGGQQTGMGDPSDESTTDCGCDGETKSGSQSSGISSAAGRGAAQSGQQMSGGTSPTTPNVE